MSIQVYIGISSMIYLICVLTLTDNKILHISVNDLNLKYEDNIIHYHVISFFIGVLWLPVCMVLTLLLSFNRLYNWSNK